MARAAVARVVMRLAVLCAAGPNLGGCTARSSSGPAPAAQTSTPVRVCTSSISPSHLSIHYALAEQIFARHQLDVQVTEIRGGSTAAAALVAGSVDLCQMAGNALVSAAVAGADLVIVGGVTNRLPYFLVSQPEITSPALLQGKALAVSSPGSGSYTAARVALSRLGLVPDRDVTILAIGGESDRLMALTSGRVAAAVLSPPQAMLAMERGYPTLFDYADLDEPYPHEVIVTTRALVKRQPALLAAYLRATSESVGAMRANRARAIEVMAEYLHLDPKTNAAALDRTYDLVVQRDMSDTLEPSLPGIQVLLDELAKDNPRAARVAPRDVVDLSLLEQLDREGFFAARRKIRD